MQNSTSSSVPAKRAGKCTKPVAPPVQPEVAQAPLPAATHSMTASDLAELMSAFNAVTGRLQETHEQLRGEVARLNRELTEANEQLGRSKRLAALGEMAAGIAHEVRNPLGSISLFARMLKDDLAENPAQQKLAEKIITATKGLNAVVGDVLTFSREFRVSHEETDVAELVARAIDACRHDGMPGWETVQFVQRSVKDAPGAMWIDPALTLQGLTNIIRNAAEAMIESGSPNRILTVDVRRSTLADSTGNRTKRIGIRVSDTGPGLSEEVLERMFNPFFTTRKAGTGLGLAIVHRIMDAHGGRVVASNNADGVGATVELLFPVEVVANRGNEKERAESSLVNSAGVPMGVTEQNLPLVAVAVRPDRRLSGAA